MKKISLKCKIKIFSLNITKAKINKSKNFLQETLHFRKSEFLFVELK